MTTPDMMEALQALAAEKGMTTELLLEAVANGLESAYKRMPEAAEEATLPPRRRRMLRGAGECEGSMDAPQARSA